ncbi:MAG: DUF2400 domain-containing protein, partial [Epsilonproteobacteria bacterium]|nr:DUF2400 domain-containing protein [Campylobacterota bacterium]
MTLQQRLDAEVAKRDYACEISPANPDPMLIARIYQDEMISLICALFAYGNARLIVKFLESFDFELLTMSDEKITRALQKHYYRFQNAQDITVFFITLKRFKEECTLEEVFLQGYQKEQSVLDGLETLISKLWSYHEYDSRGYKFLLGNIPHTKSSSTYKRWNMFLRWMVR